MANNHDIVDLTCTAEVRGSIPLGSTQKCLDCRQNIEDETDPLNTHGSAVVKLAVRTT